MNTLHTTITNMTIPILHDATIVNLHRMKTMNSDLVKITNPHRIYNSYIRITIMDVAIAGCASLPYTLIACDMCKVST